MPKKRILPYIILGLLAQHEGMTGRQITRQFQNEIGEFWKAARSQIYPELRQMVQDKWIEKYVKADNDKEIYYKLLPLGKQKLTRWIEEPLEDLPVSQDLFSLKLFFIQDVNPSGIASPGSGRNTTARNTAVIPENARTAAFPRWS